jgi:uncharacterized membrane protein
MKPTPNSRCPWLRKLSAQTRLFISIAVAALISFLLPSKLYVFTRLICLWDVGVFCFLALSLFVMLTATPDSMRQRARSQNEGQLEILSLIGAAACASLLAIGFMLKDSKNAPPDLAVFHVILAFITIIESWSLVHIVFTFHYAYLYYGSSEAGGLDFPSDEEPDYKDFLYFAFTIGMTSQTSDVAVTRRSLRRLTLLHGILSFFFNTTILALGINMIAGLL